MARDDPGGKGGRPLRVLLLLSSLHGGGAERVATHLLKLNDGRTMEVRIGLLRRAGPFLADADPALVMAPDKVTYRVKPGDYMGQSDGRVTGVYEDRVELVELVPDGAGGWLERPAKLALEDN